MEPSDTIGEVVARFFGIGTGTLCVGAAAHRLARAERTLEEGRILSDYNIQSGTTLHLLPAITLASGRVEDGP